MPFHHIFFQIRCGYFLVFIDLRLAFSFTAALFDDASYRTLSILKVFHKFLSLSLRLLWPCLVITSIVLSNLYTFSFLHTRPVFFPLESRVFHIMPFRTILVEN